MLENIPSSLLLKAIDQTGVGVVLSNPRQPDNPIVYVNKGFEDITGYSAEEIVGLNCRFLQGENTELEAISKIRDSIQNAIPCEIEILNYRKNGEMFWNELNLTPLFDSNGEVEYFLGIQKDVTKRKATEDALMLYEKVFRNTRQGVMITDASTQIIHVNEAFTRITGFTQEETIGNKPSMLSSGKQSQSFYKMLWEELKLNGQWEGEIWNMRKNGEVFPEFLNISEVRNKDGEITNYVAIFTDITKAKKREQQLAKLSMRDSLTGIGNRRAFDLYLQEKWEELAKLEEPLALIMLDVDFFKLYNDAHGHLAGDEALIQVARCLEHSIGADVALAVRYGGEEFAVLLPQYDEESAVEIAERIRIEIKRLGILHGHLDANDSLSVSCGVASVIPSFHGDVYRLLKAADEALYLAKKNGRDCVMQYKKKREKIQ